MGKSRRQEDDHPLVSLSRGHLGSRSRSIALAFWLVFAVLLLGGGTAAALYYFGREPTPTEPKPMAAKSKPAEIVTPRPDAPKKKVVPTVEKKPPAKVEDDLSAKIDAATRKGVDFLKQSIQASGTWRENDDTNAVGYAALPGLALLECGVPAKDPVVQQAAAYVRSHAGQLKDTYDIGVALLFLDTLGETADKKLIQTLALRLMAGQTAAGGWTYECPILNDDENDRLLAFLNSHKPEIKFLVPLQTAVVDPSPREKIDREPMKPKVDKKPAEKPLPVRVRKLPIVAAEAKKFAYEESGVDDNSNTHFALLGLWAARRHDVPVELSLSLTAERFQKTQAKDGGWGYVIDSPPKNTMSCVGLLGLAMGHGSAAELFAEAAIKNKIPPKGLARDPAIQNGLKALGQYLEGDDSLRGLESRLDLYYLWTLERVGMLYRQKEIGKKDWFDYGARLILQKQQEDGYWKIHYDSPVDTAFALLFLNRSDLVEDLTRGVQAYLEIPNATLRVRELPEGARTRERGRPETRENAP